MEGKGRLMNTKLAVALALTVGFVGGGIVSKYLSPISALAQSNVPIGLAFYDQSS